MAKSRLTLVAHVLRIAIVFSLLVAISKDDLEWILGCITGIVISSVPFFLKRFLNIELPGIVDFMIALALFLHLGMARIFDVYYAIPEFDMVTHFVSSVLIAFLALIALHLLDKYWDGLFINIYAIGFAVVVITVASGVVWELGEWAGGMLLGMPFQVDLHDTMMDLLFDTIGGTVMATVGVILIKTGRLEEMTEDLGKQVDYYINHNKKQ